MKTAQNSEAVKYLDNFFIPNLVDTVYEQWILTVWGGLCKGWREPLPLAY
jgi:hypothetical protein